MANDLNLRVRVQTADAKSELASFRGDVESLATRVKSLTQSVVIGASLDASNVLAGIANIKRAVNGLRIDVNAQFDDSAARAAIESFRNGLRGETVRITVDVVGVVGARYLNRAAGVD